SLALSLRSLDQKDVTFMTAPMERYDNIDGQSVVIIDEKKTKELFQAVADDDIDSYFEKYGKDGSLGKAHEVR
ncbi:MAG: hypothetical protein ACRDPJ_02840, partial [Nocardioidaceae bacterium]